MAARSWIRRSAGEQWNFGAVSTAEWTGVPLWRRCWTGRCEARRCKRCCSAASTAAWWTDVTNRFILSEACASTRPVAAEVLLAYAMNGEALPMQHGYPLRVIVPSWYAVASVKWLDRHRGSSTSPSADIIRRIRYVFERQRDGRSMREPVTLQRVRSLITEPEADAEIERGEFAIRGVAWSGAAPIARVDVKVNGGPWQAARLVGTGSGTAGNGGSFSCAWTNRVRWRSAHGRPISRGGRSLQGKSGIGSATEITGSRRSACRLSSSLRAGRQRNTGVTFSPYGRAGSPGILL